MQQKIIPDKVRNFWRWLTHIHADITDIYAYSRAKFLSNMMLLLIGVGSTILIVLLIAKNLVDDYPIVIMPGLLVYGGIYWLNRSGRIKLASGSLMISLVLVFAFLTVTANNQDITIAVIIILITALFASGRMVVVVTGLLLLAHVGLTRFSGTAPNPDFLSIMILFSAMMLLATNYFWRLQTLQLAELEKVNAALRQSEATLEQRVQEQTTALRKFQTAIEQSAISVAITNPAGVIEYVNPYFTELSGYTADEIMGKTPHLLQPADAPAALYEDLWPTLSAGRQWHGEFRNRKKNGDDFWELATISPIIDDTGVITHLVEIKEDITVRKLMEESLRASEERYRMLVDNQTDLIIRVDLEGRFLFVSPSYCTMFGKTEEELLGHTFMPLVHEDDQESTALAMEKLYVPPYTCYVEQRAYTKDGWRWLAWVDTAILDEDSQEVAAIIGVGRDITEQKLAEEQIRESEARLKEAERLAGMGHWRLDPVTNVAQWSDEVYRIFNLEPPHQPEDRTLSQVFWESIHPDDRPFVEQSYDYSLHNGEPYDLVFRLVLADGIVKSVNEKCQIIIDETGAAALALGTIQDITTEQHILEQLITSLAEKETLLQEVHHRVKNNLQIVASLLHLQSQASANEEVRQVLARSQARVHAIALIHEKLYQSTNVASISMDEYITDLTRHLRLAFEHDTAQVQVALDVAAITLDLDNAIPCGLIINELVSNAFKYAFPAGQGGVIAIIMRQETDDLRLIIRDDGVGLPPDLDTRRTQSLGLRLVHSLVQQLHSTLTIENHQGASFTIRIPYE